MMEIPTRILLTLATAPLAASCFVFQSGPYNYCETVEGRALYAPVLAAIDDHHRGKAAYPGKLANLVPVFILYLLHHETLPGHPLREAFALELGG